GVSPTFVHRRSGGEIYSLKTQRRPEPSLRFRGRGGALPLPQGDSIQTLAFLPKAWSFCKQVVPDPRGELAGGDGPLVLGLDQPVPADQERPRLGRQAPLAHPAVVALGRVVPLEDLDVNEAHALLLEAAPDPVDHVHDRPADAAGAELRRGEGDDEGAV